MKDCSKKKWIKIFVICLWVFLWVFFHARAFYKEDLWGKYVSLTGVSDEQRRARTIGVDLYNFIQFCLAELPESATYQIVGLEEKGHDYIRVLYYLYPHLLKNDPQYVLVFNSAEYSKAGFKHFHRLNDRTCILKKDDE